MGLVSHNQFSSNNTISTVSSTSTSFKMLSQRSIGNVFHKISTIKTAIQFSKNDVAGMAVRASKKQTTNIRKMALEVFPELRYVKTKHAMAHCAYQDAVERLIRDVAPLLESMQPTTGPQTYLVNWTYKSFVPAMIELIF